MHNAKFIDASISIDNLFENANRFLLGNGPAHFDHFSQVTSIAELGDDAGV
jgi:hypothetical protein